MKSVSIPLARVLILLAAVFRPGCSVFAFQAVQVQWSPNPERDIVGYNVYYRDSARKEISKITVANTTSAIISGLPESRTYLFYVTAVNTSALESDPSDSVSFYANAAPALLPIEDQTAEVGLTLTVVPTASDPDSGQTFAFALAPGAPSGSVLDPATGVFTWTPSPDYSGKISQITIQVADNGTPPLFATATFKVSVQAPDSDGDGIPDWNERLTGLNPLDPKDGAADQDGDGFSNLDEFEAGTDPNDGTSALRITSVAPVGDDVAIQFTAVTGRQYRVEASSGPEQIWSWTPVADHVAGVSPVVTVIDTGGNREPERFYRITVLP